MVLPSPTDGTTVRNPAKERRTRRNLTYRGSASLAAGTARETGMTERGVSTQQRRHPADRCHRPLLGEVMIWKERENSTRRDPQPNGPCDWTAAGQGADVLRRRTSREFLPAVPASADGIRTVVIDLWKRTTLKITRSCTRN
ncbi:hypothetical protein BHE74_00035306 [Ensete ventricosum]|nr:hypothetical protein GW17_00034892 [Ensete ventricosum]RWW57874.1 hypothetical protein BHE74_00035306 [Ensete ventricosum]RZS02868.1 hypothetical protein BHM03_00032981 [Ensete ventricosum]